ncbi:MAG: terminase small subunit [Gammaproteobacteria bacterium]|nr:terminase small subunit [Gammaproteobacteria bacterium]
MKKVIKKNGVNGKKTLHKELLAAEEYLKNGFNGTHAYSEIYKNNNPLTCAVEGSKLLRKPNVMAYIDKRITEMLLKLSITSEVVLAEQAKLAFVDIRSMFQDDVFVGINSLNIAQQSCIESIEYEELFNGVGESKVHVGRKAKIKFYSRQKAIDNLMKYKGLIKDNTSNTVVLDNRKIEVNVASENLKEKLGASTIIELNRKLSRRTRKKTH